MSVHVIWLPGWSFFAMWAACVAGAHWVLGRRLSAMRNLGPADMLVLALMRAGSETIVGFFVFWAVSWVLVAFGIELGFAG